MYAIFRAQGKQFKVEAGQTIKLPRMEAEPGSKVTFDEVLLISDGDTITAGTPTVKGAKVEAEVVRETKGEKIYVCRSSGGRIIAGRWGHRAKFTGVPHHAVTA
jgi:large subunit ribosomal protein L21